MSTPELFVDFAEALGQDLQFRQLLPTHGQLHPQIVLWLCWVDRRGGGIARSGLQEAQAVVAGDNVTLLEHLCAAEANLDGPARFTRVQQNLIRKHIGAARSALERVLQQRLQDLTPRLAPANASDESLSLFDYFSELGLEDPATSASALLQLARQHTFTRKAEPLVQP